MKYEFEVYQMKVEDHLFWVAKSKVLKGCVGQGETASEAISELEANENDWLETAAFCHIPIPSASVRTDVPQYSGKMSLRFSPFVHEQASDLAKKQGISLNQYINDAIVYYNSMITERASNNATSTKTIEKTSSSIIHWEPRGNISFSRIHPYKKINRSDKIWEEM